MTNKHLFGTSLKVVAALLMVAIMAIGCSNSPVNSSSEPTVLSRSVASLNSPMLSGASSYAEVIISDATGGTLSLIDVILEIPPGAVGNDTLFSIDIPDLSVFFNDFGTDGLVFNVPVKVTMSYRDADLSDVSEETIRLGWFNEESGKWVDMECTVDHESKTVSGYLTHFSAYGVISD